jgi:hypothetical protein
MAHHDVTQDTSVVMASVRPFVVSIPARCKALLVVLGAGLAALAAPDQAAAQGAVQGAVHGSVEAQYEASLAGVLVGKGSWRIDITDDQYAAAAQGGSAGLLKAFAGGSGTGAVQGRVVNGQFQPTGYTATTTTSKKSETIRMTLAGGGIKESSIEPEPPLDNDRIPVTDAHRRGVMDPMTGTMLRVAGNGDPLSPESCRAATPVFDGRMRYDLKFEFKRMETVQAEKGYRGPALVCAIYFTPISGYIGDRAAIKYLIAQRDMEVWLVPIAGTRVLVPFKLKIPTPIGGAVLQATQFVTSATPPRAASRTQ